MGERTRRAGNLIDEIAALRRLPSGQDFADQAVMNVVGRYGRASPLWRKERDVGVADDGNAGLRLQVHPLDVLAQVELTCERRRRTRIFGEIRQEFARVPRRPRVSKLVGARRVSTGAVEWIDRESSKRRRRTRSLRKRAQALRTVGARPHDVRLIVEDE